MGKIFRNEKHSEQGLILESNSTKAIFCYGISEDTLAVGSNSNTSESQGKVWSRPQHTCNSGGVHPFTGYKALHINKDFTPIAIFPIFFMDVTHLLVAEINKYYNLYFHA
jgi:hypothetical protein